jgi:uncharacterized protein YebE (UPF0316 family)
MQIRDIIIGERYEVKYQFGYITVKVIRKTADGKHFDVRNVRNDEYYYGLHYSVFIQRDI